MSVLMVVLDYILRSLSNTADVLHILTRTSTSVSSSLDMSLPKVREVLLCWVSKIFCILFKMKFIVAYQRHQLCLSHVILLCPVYEHAKISATHLNNTTQISNVLISADECFPLKHCWITWSYANTVVYGYMH